MQYKAGPGSEGISHNLTSLLIYCDERSERDRERERDKDRETMVTAALCNKPVVSLCQRTQRLGDPLSLSLSPTKVTAGSKVSAFARGCIRLYKTHSNVCVCVFASPWFIEFMSVMVFECQAKRHGP